MHIHTCTDKDVGPWTLGEHEKLGGWSVARKDIDGLLNQLFTLLGSPRNSKPLDYTGQRIDNPGTNYPKPTFQAPGVHCKTLNLKLSTPELNPKPPNSKPDSRAP